MLENGTHGWDTGVEEKEEEECKDAFESERGHVTRARATATTQKTSMALACRETLF